MSFDEHITKMENILLDKYFPDICTFLTKEAQDSRMSTRTKNEARKLINRSKQQLQELAKMTSHFDSDDRYVDMHGNKGELGRCFLKHFTTFISIYILCRSFRR